MDLHWSVEPQQPGEDYGETDLIAVNQENLYEELIDDNDSMARCHDEGWFYSDDE